jgi:NAD(P)H-hydrate repair Nnr-like enzyme with NAD(P)H-hydrate dehydratase domain
MVIKNTPDIWHSALPRKTADGHKYTYGHAVIYGAPELTGATRLAAAACARMGTGLVSVLAPKGTGYIYRTALPAHILVRDDMSWNDPRITAKLYGAGGLAASIDYEANIPVILDADALGALPEKLSPHYILTPHEGRNEKNLGRNSVWSICARMDRWQ